MKHRKYSKNKKVLFLGIVLLLILLVAGSFFFINNQDSGNETTDVSYSPPTEEEKQQAENNKERLVADQEKNSDNTSGENTNTTVMPVIVSVSSSELRGYVPGVAEENGACTAYAEKDGISRSGSSQGFINVSYTQCAPIQWNTPLSEGSWQVTLEYASNTVTGNSVQTVEVSL